MQRFNTNNHHAIVLKKKVLSLFRCYDYIFSFKLLKGRQDLCLLEMLKTICGGKCIIFLRSYF